MKRIVSVFVGLLLSVFAFSSPLSLHPKSKSPNAADIMVPIGTNHQISLLDLSMISVKDVEAITGKEMSTADRMGFKFVQKQLRNTINEDGTLNDKKIARAAKKADSESGFHLGGFALGFLLGLIGVLIAYLINDDVKMQRRKWAWLGFAAGLVLGIIFLIL